MFFLFLERVCLLTKMGRTPRCHWGLLYTGLYGHCTWAVYSFWEGLCNLCHTSYTKNNLQRTDTKEFKTRTSQVATEPRKPFSLTEPLSSNCNMFQPQWQHCPCYIVWPPQAESIITRLVCESPEMTPSLLNVITFKVPESAATIEAVFLQLQKFAIKQVDRDKFVLQKW